MAVGAAMDLVNGGAVQTPDGHLDSILTAVGRLVEEQGARLDSLRSSHEALTEAFHALQCCQKLPLSASALGSAEAAAEAAAQALAAPISRAPAPMQSSLHPDVASGHCGLSDEVPPTRAQERLLDISTKNRARGPNGERASSVPPRGNNEGLTSSALAAVAAAHRRGLATADLRWLSDEEWESLGASPHDRDTILGAVAEWQQQQQRQRPEGQEPESRYSSPCVAYAKDHLQGGVAEGDAPGAHGNAKDTYFEGGLERGIGHGRRHNIGMRDHIQGGTAVGDGIGAHGHYKAHDFQIGFGKQRCASKTSSVVDSSVPCLPGHGRDDVEDMDSRPIRARHFIAAKDHIRGGTTAEHAESDESLGRRKYIGPVDHIYAGAASDCVPGAHGHLKDSALQGGMSRCIGHGKHHINVRDHIRGGTAIQDQPGSHGHNKDDDFEGSLARGMGRGKHHMSSIEDQIRAAAAAGQRCLGSTLPAKFSFSGPEIENLTGGAVTPQNSTGGAVTPQERAAGLPTASTSPTYGNNFRRAASATPAMRRNCW